MTEKYIMISLEEDKAKELANVISNKTSRKILNILSEESLSESDIAKRLELPASTVNYNIKHLSKNNLIKIKEFYWSEKGNKINVYTVSKKFIVIAPRGVKFKESLKKIIPVSLLALVGASLIQLLGKARTPSTFLGRGADVITNVPAKEAILAAPMLETSINYGLWFFMGALFVILIYLIFDYWRYVKNEK